LETRDVGDNDLPIARDIEPRRLDDAAFFAADLDDLLRLRSGGIDAVDGLTPPVEHIVSAARRLLKADGILENADDVRRNAADRTKDFNSDRRRWRDGKNGHSERQSEDAASHGEEQLNTTPGP
jgi:hypothetical protein